MIGIYKIQSLIKPERLYIGSAVSVNRRKALHFCQLRKNNHHSIKLQNHYNKYGESDLQFSVLLECPKEQLIAREQDFIDALNPWFNILKKAHSALGYKHTKESLKKISIGRKGKKHSQESKEKISKNRSGQYSWWNGKHHSKQTIEKLRELNIGHHHSEETKQKISQGGRRLKRSDETKQRIREARLGTKKIKIDNIGGTFKWERF